MLSHESSQGGMAAVKHVCPGGERDRISHTPKLQGNTGAPSDAQRYTKREKELSPQLHFVYKFNRTLSRGRSGTLAYHVQALSSSPSNWLATSLLGYGSVVTPIPGVGHREDKQKQANRQTSGRCPWVYFCSCFYLSALCTRCCCL